MSDTHVDLNDPDVDPFEVARAAATVIAERTGVERHDVALVLGSGWGGAADLIGETRTVIDNADVPGFSRAAVVGHSGTIRSVSLGDTDRRALVYGTRTHFYEGKGVRAVVHPVRTAADVAALPEQLAAVESIEAIAARHAGLEILGISLVTNPAAGTSDQALSHQEVIEAGQAAAARCGRLLADVVTRIATED